MHNFITPSQKINVYNSISHTYIYIWFKRTFQKTKGYKIISILIKSYLKQRRRFNYHPTFPYSVGIAACPWRRIIRIYRIMKTLIASKQDDTTIRSPGENRGKIVLACTARMRQLLGGGLLHKWRNPPSLYPRVIELVYCFYPRLWRRRNTRFINEMTSEGRSWNYCARKLFFPFSIWCSKGMIRAGIRNRIFPFNLSV